MMTNIVYKKRTRIVHLGTALCSHEYLKYAWESSLEFNYRVRIENAGTLLLITIVTPATILTILLKIIFISHNESE